MDQKFSNELWYYFLTGEWRIPPTKWMRLISETQRKVYSLLPSDPHCFACGIPLSGVGAKALWFMGSKPSTFSSKLCIKCDEGVRKYESGAEVELTMLFADVRDSTPLAELKGTMGFKEIIDRFYKETSHVLIEHNAMVNRLMGDQVIALFVPRFAGKNHPQVAVRAAYELLRVTGHGNKDGPWVAVGAGIHTGRVYVGAVGSATGVNEIAVLGSAANLCARLSSRAAMGEILISEESVRSGNLEVSALESRALELKGVVQPVTVNVMKIQ